MKNLLVDYVAKKAGIDFTEKLVSDSTYIQRWHWLIWEFEFTWSSSGVEYCFEYQIFGKSCYFTPSKFSWKVVQTF
jgi:hypothetical protein